MLLECWQTGGTERYVGRLGHFLKDNGRFDLFVALLGDAEELELCEARQWATGVYPLGRTRGESLWRLPRLVRELRPDVCHCHLYTSLLPATLILRALRVPRLVTTFHMPLSAWNRRHRLMWRAAAGLAHHVVCNSWTVARSFGPGRAARRLKAAVVPPPFPQAPAPERQITPTPTSAFTVCGCGRLSPEKDWPTLLRAFAALEPEVDRPTELVLLGHGPLEEEIRGLASQLGIAEHVRMPGRVDHPTVIETLRRCDVSVLPSRFEGLGMAALEAMQYGVPTITADFEASYDFLEDGVTGHRFPHGNWKRLQALLAWHCQHPDQSRAMGLRGQQSLLKTFSEENTFRKYLNVYSSESHDLTADVP